MSGPRRIAAVVVSVVALGASVTAIMMVLAPSPASILSGSVRVPEPQTTAAAVAAPTPTLTPSVPPVPPPCAATAPGVKEIYVSISQQHLWACTGSVLLVDAAVTTGASALTNVRDATPVGLARIRAKERNVVLTGHDVNGKWNDPVTYWMPFNGGDGFHDAPWQTFPLGSPLYTTQGSHGCVHVGLAVLTQLFSWAQVGTLVDVRA